MTQNSQQSSNIKKIAKEQILSPQDEDLFEKYLSRNKQFVLITKSKNSDFEQTFPLYFGTTEDEINPHRKMALRQKRINRDPHYNTPQSLQNQQKHKKSAITTDQPKSKLSSQQTSNPVLQKSNESTKVTSKSTPQSQEQHQTFLQSQSQQQPPQQISNKTNIPKKQDKLSTPNSITPEPITNIATPTSVKPTANGVSKPAKEALKPAPVPTMATMLASSKSLAESLKRPHANNGSASSSPSSRSKPTSKSNTASPASSSTSIFDTVSSEFLSSTAPKPLGITLLRIMFDSQYINRIFNKKDETNLIYPHGLQNSGNICYMNSILQFLFYCEPFSQILNIIRETTIKELDESKSKTPILNALLDLQDSFKIAPKTLNKFDVINPDHFYSSIASLPRFSHLTWGRQEDAEELLNILLDGLHEEFVESIKILPTADVNRFANAFNNKETSRKILQNVDFIKDLSKENASSLDNNDWNEVGSNMKTIGKRSFQVKLSPIVNLFGGQFKSVLKASNKKSSITLDPFMQVQLDISDPETTDLTTAFEKFSQDEEVSLGSTMAKKQNFIDKLPSILIIHLKRFSFVTNDESNSENGDYELVTKNKKNKKNNKESSQQNFAQQSKSKLLDGRIEKIHKFIKYDHKLTLPKSCISTMVSEEPNYKLLGVVYHHGRSTENGHYTTDVSTSSGQWIRIDDTNITNITPADAVSDQNLLSNINKTAYILMFQKV